MNAEIGNLSFMQRFRKLLRLVSFDRIDPGINSTAVYRMHRFLSASVSSLLTHSTSLVLDRTWDLPCLAFDRMFDAVGPKLFRSVGPICLVGFDTDSTGHGSAYLCSHFYYHRSFLFSLFT